MPRCTRLYELPHKPGGADQLSNFPTVRATCRGPLETCHDVSPVFRTGILDPGCLFLNRWPEHIICISGEETQHWDSFINSPRESHVTAG